MRACAPRGFAVTVRRRRELQRGSLVTLSKSARHRLSLYPRGLAAAFILLASSLTWRAHADAPLPDAEASARPSREDDAVLLARSGDRARVAGHFAEAEASYRASLALAPDPETELSLALALAAQGKALQAAPLLARLQRTLPDDADDSTSGNRDRATSGTRSRATSGNRDRATSGNHDRATSGNRDRATSGNRDRATSGSRSRAARALADVRRELATLAVDTGVAGAVVEVDGAPVGVSPLPDPVFVAPGKHTVRAWKDRHLAAGATFDAAAATSYAVEVLVVAKPPDLRQSLADSTSAEGAGTGPPLSRLDTFFVGPAGGARAAGIALTVTGLVGGLSALAAAEVSDVSARAISARIRRAGVGSCGSAVGEVRADCADLDSAVTAREAASTAAGVLFTSAGVASVATFLSVFLLPPARPLGQTGGLNVTLSPIAGPTGGGVSLEALW